MSIQGRTDVVSPVDGRKRSLFGSVAALLLGAALVGPTASAFAQSATKPKVPSARSVDRFLAELGKRFRAQFKAHADDPPGPAGIAPKWVHTLVDDLWDYFFK